MIQQPSTSSQRYDQIFPVPLESVSHPNLNLPILQLLAPSPNQILILHTPNEKLQFPYTLLQVHSKTQAEIIKTGVFPTLLQGCGMLNKDVTVGLGSFTEKLSESSSFKTEKFDFLQNNTKFNAESQDNYNQQLTHLLFFNIRLGTLVGVLSYTFSQIYNQRCLYHLCRPDSNHLGEKYSMVLFYKISQFKSINENRSALDYEIGVFQACKKQNTNQLELRRVRKYREEFSKHHTLTFFENQVMAIQLTGYSIQVYLLQTKQRYIINSIYSLLLVDNIIKNGDQQTQLLQKSHKDKSHSSKEVFITNKAYCQLHFTYDDLDPDEVLSYAVDLSGITKLGKKKRVDSINSVYMGTENRVAEFNTFFHENSSKFQPSNQSNPHLSTYNKQVPIIMKIELEQRTKYLFLLNHRFEHYSIEFKETVLELLQS